MWNSEPNPDDGKVEYKGPLKRHEYFSILPMQMRFSSLKDPGYLNLIVVGKSGAKSVIGEFDGA